MATKGLEQGQFLRYVRTVGMTTMRGRGFYYPVSYTHLPLPTNREV